MRARIAGTGRYVPRRAVSNTELAPLVGESPEEIARRTGIDTRHFAEQHEAASDLALAASIEALDAAGFQAHDVDCIVFATHTPDYFFPGSGCILGAKLGIPGVPAYDVRNQCSGFLYALSMADAFVRAGTYERVLVVAAEVMSAGLEFSPRGREAATIFGDGAGAAIVVREHDDTRGILGLGLHADGRFAHSLMVALPGSHRHGGLTAKDLEEGRHLPVVGGFEIVEQGYRHLLGAIREGLDTCGLTADDVALFIPNQGTAQLVPLLARRLHVPQARMYVNLRECGNATGASIPMSLDTLVRSDRVHPGDVLFLCAFGSGFTWGWGALRW
jgi:3-oxoacyl-[acyl-carrier-protein] synthase-3